MIALLRIVLTSLLATGLCLPATAQERHTVPVTVVDEEGKIVEGLTAANFRAEFRGDPVEIVSAELDADPKVVLILVDASASVLGSSHVAKILQGAARDAISELSKENKVSTYEFSVGPLVPLIIGSQVASVEERVSEGKNKKKRKTALLDAVGEASNLMAYDGFGSVVVLISDGSDNRSKTNKRGLIQTLVSEGVRLFHICVAEPLAVGEIEGMAPLCQELGEATGGLGFRQHRSLVWRDGRPVSLAGVLEKARSFYPTIGNVYKLDLDIPVTVDRQRKWKLEVVDENGKKMKGVTVHYPQYLVPLETPAED